MNRDAQIIQQVEDALDGKGSSFGMTMTTTWVKEEGKEAELRMISKRVGGPDPSLPLEELERNADSTCPLSICL